MQFLEKAPVVVIGAGLAGLTAAWRLRQAGEEVVVLEATDQVGGRTLSSREGWLDSQYANLGGELIDLSYHAVRSLCADVGVELTEPQVYSEPRQGDLSAMEGYLRVARFVVNNELLSREECDRVAAGLRSAAETRPPQPHEIVEQWLRRARLAQPAAGVVRALARFFTQLDPWDCDVHFIFGPQAGAFQRVRGGTQQLALALARDLDVRVEQPVVRVQRGRGVRVTTASGEELSASRVICAVGPFAVSALGFDPPLPDERVMAATSLLPAMAGKVIAQYTEGDLVRDAFGSLVCTDGPIDSAWVSVTDDSCPLAVVTAFFAGADRGYLGRPDAAHQMLDELVEKVVGQPVTRVHGEVKSWWADPLQLGVNATPAAEARATIAAVLGAAEHETHYAGDYTDAPMSGTLEGAVRSGFRAADEVLRAADVFHTDFVTERLSRA